MTEQNTLLLNAKKRPKMPTIPTVKYNVRERFTQRLYIDAAQPFVLPPYWESEAMAEANAELVALKNLPFSCPLAFSWEDEPEWWTFPIDPVITIGGSNNVVKRTPMKTASGTVTRGTIKELWSQNDYEITISGLFINSIDNKIPGNDLLKLRGYCEGRQTVLVMSDLFTVFNIKRIAIESFDLPFTAGKANQQFTIKAVSDDFDADSLII